MRKLFILVVAVSISFTSDAQESKHEIRLPFIKQVLSEKIGNAIDKTGIPSISIALIHEDQVIWSEAFGYSNLKTKSPATISTVYATGSTVKPYLSMAVLQLVEKGKLDLDEPVSKYLKEPISKHFSEGKPITLRHLLSNQSGLSASANFTDLWRSKGKRALVDIVRGLSPVRAPEEQYEYSNDGFVMAALAIENVSGVSYGDYIAENILEPLGLYDVSFIGPTPEVVERLALPYETAYGSAFPVGLQYPEPYPAGGFTFLSPTEASRFLIAHINNGRYRDSRLLSESSIKKFHSTSFDHEYYGLGIAVEEKNGEIYLSHSGLQRGYTASFEVNVNRKTGVFLMANAGAEDVLRQLTALSTKLINGGVDSEDFDLPSIKRFEPIVMAESELESFTGTYKFEQADVYIEILVKNKKIYLKNPLGERIEILPFGANQFFLKTVEEQIRFIISESEVSGLILMSKTGSIVATKI